MINLYITDISTNNVVELPFNSLNLTEELNTGKDCRMSLDYYAVKEVADRYNTTPLFILTSGIRRVTVEKDGTPIFLGVITDYSTQLGTDGAIKIEVYAVGYFNLFAKRRTNAKRVFSSVDAGDIAWTLIDESQQSDLPYSDFGVTQGLVTASVDRDRTFRFANIKEEITKMSNKNLENGFDFEIDNFGDFNVFYPEKGSNRPNLVLDEQNIVSWGVRKPLIMSLTNKVYVLGEGFNDDVLYVTRQSINAYKTTFKLLEEVLPAREIITTETLNDKGDKYLMDFQSPILQIQITHVDGEPDILDYEVGDSLKVNILQVDVSNTFKRVYKRAIRIDSNSHTLVTLDFK